MLIVLTLLAVLAFLTGIVLLIINAVRRRPLKLWLFVILGGFVLTIVFPVIGSATISPKNEAPTKDTNAQLFTPTPTPATSIPSSLSPTPRTTSVATPAPTTPSSPQSPIPTPATFTQQIKNTPNPSPTQSVATSSVPVVKSNGYVVRGRSVLLGSVVQNAPSNNAAVVGQLEFSFYDTSSKLMRIGTIPEGRYLLPGEERGFVGSLEMPSIGTFGSATQSAIKAPKWINVKRGLTIETGVVETQKADVGVLSPGYKTKVMIRNPYDRDITMSVSRINMIAFDKQGRIVGLGFGEPNLKVAGGAVAYATVNVAVDGEAERIEAYPEFSLFPEINNKLPPTIEPPPVGGKLNVTSNDGIEVLSYRFHEPGKDETVRLTLPHGFVLIGEAQNKTSKSRNVKLQLQIYDDKGKAVTFDDKPIDIRYKIPLGKVPPGGKFPFVYGISGIQLRMFQTEFAENPYENAALYYEAESKYYEALSKLVYVLKISAESAESSLSDDGIEVRKVFMEDLNGYTIIRAQVVNKSYNYYYDTWFWMTFYDSNSKIQGTATVVGSSLGTWSPGQEVGVPLGVGAGSISLEEGRYAIGFTPSGVRRPQDPGYSVPTPTKR